MNAKPTLVIKPYVTAKGGIVILNGPFPIGQANRIAALCEAAPELLEGCERAEAYLQGIRSGRRFEEGDLVDVIKTAIVKAGRGDYD